MDVLTKFKKKLLKTKFFIFNRYDVQKKLIRLLQYFKLFITYIRLASNLLKCKNTSI